VFSSTCYFILEVWSTDRELSRGRLSVSRIRHLTVKQKENLNFFLIDSFLDPHNFDHGRDASHILLGFLCVCVCRPPDLVLLPTAVLITSERSPSEKI
jgi:hypothetical protein